MKILVINWQCIKNPYGGGAEVHLHNIFKRIAAQGSDVTLLCCKTEGLSDEEEIDGIKIIRRGSRSLFNFGVRRIYRERFKNQKFDIVIDDINKIPFYTPLYVKEPLLAISHHFFGSSIFREAGFVKGSYVAIGEMLVDWVYKKTPFAVVSQSTLDEFISRGFRRELFSIVPNAIDQSEFPCRVGEKFERPTVTYFGRLKKYKSVDHILKGFALMKSKIPEADLHIIGRGDFMSDLKRLTSKLGIDECTTFFGFVSEEEKKELLAKSWMVINSSMKEGWGITNIESNACGTPVISADVPGLRDSVSVGKSGLLYDYGNINQLADLMANIINDNNLRNRLSEGAVEWAKSFSWDESARLMYDKIEGTISEFK